MPGFFVCLRRAVCPISTCVGNTSRPSTIPTSSTVHPHMRGEYLRYSSAQVSKIGSSPRAWGILLIIQTTSRCMRFIPTCVGNTADRRPEKRHPPVHPHVRGEYACSENRRAANHGSSPRAWGIRHRLVAHFRTSWFIPTCVGNTCRKSKTECRTSVHPHVRGEYVRGGAVAVEYGGSSPRAWGILKEVGQRLGINRFIPTCVGNTVYMRWECIGYAVHPHVRGEYITICLWRMI